MRLLFTIYYRESVDDISNALGDRADIDTIITLPNTIDMKMLRLVLKRFKRSFVVLTENRGRDVLPFIKAARAIDLTPYQWVLKLHGKRSVHLKSGDVWRQQLFSALLDGMSSRGTQPVHRDLPADERVGLAVAQAVIDVN